MKLYDLGLSPNCLKVRAVSNELGLSLELIQVDLMKHEAKTPEFRTKNPNTKIPVLDDNGFLLWESNAIIKYLALKRPEKHLLPQDPKHLALVDQWLFWQSAHFYPPIIQLAVEQIFKPMGGAEPDLAVVAQMQKEFLNYTEILNQQLEGKNFVLGHLSVVDFSLAASLYPRKQVGLDISRFTHVENWLANIETRPSWIQALPAL